MPEPTTGAEPEPPPDPTTDPTTDPAPGPRRPVDGRARLAGALRRPASRGQVVAGALLAVLGFAAVTQVRSNEQDDSFVGARQGDLIQFINNVSLASQRAETEIAELRETRESLGNDTEARRTALALARRQADTLGILAGTVPAVGPGIRATVSGGGTGVGSDQLLNGLQELRDAGAEVIEINGSVRVVAQTSLQDTANGGVLVDGAALKPPYVIEAIGDPSDLAVALDFTGGFVSDVESVGGTVTVDELDKVDIMSVRTPRQPEYAQPESTE